MTLNKIGLENNIKEIDGNDYTFLSKYRTPLMGLAIIGIIICHNSIVFPGKLEKFNALVRNFCEGGVDLFLLLSGIGCWFSYSKELSAWNFYKRRLFKIIPPYILVIVSYGMLCVGIWKRNFSEYLFQYTLLSFWTDGILSEWYIAAILVLYMVTPILVSLLQRNPSAYRVLVCGIYVICFWVSLNDLPRNVIVVNEIFCSRIPTFMCGLAIGRNITQKVAVRKNCRKYYKLTATVVSMGWLLNWFIRSNNWHVVSRFCFLPMILMMALLVCREFEKGNLRINLFVFFGNVTLEIYLLHEKILGIVSSLVGKVILEDFWCSLVSNILAVMIALMSAYLLQYIIRLGKNIFCC